MPLSPNDLPRQCERMMALPGVRAYTAKFTTPTKLQKASNSRITNATDVDIKIDDQVLVFRDDSGCWGGPYRMADVNSKVVLFDPNSRLVQYSIGRFKRYRLADNVQDMMHNSENAADVALKEYKDRHSEQL